MRIFKLHINIKLLLIKFLIKTLNKFGLNVASVSDYYSPLPVLSELNKNVDRWNKPSILTGIHYDINQGKELLKNLLTEYGSEYFALADYYENSCKGYGPGYNSFDAMLLYFMIRNYKPKKYIEVGSGLSTYYCKLAAEQNTSRANPLQITCIEPYPYENLYNIENINIIKEEVQNVKVSFFEQLEENDILFIDSSHVVKIDGDVPYLFLEVLPKLKKGVLIHIHDIPFPYNIPFPAAYWIVNKKLFWPYFWNEAMILQAFLSFNDSFDIIMSTPLIRYYDENFLIKNFPKYETINHNPNTFSSIWIKRVK